MSKRDGAAIDIHLCGIELQFFHHGQGLHGERFVQFDQIDIASFHPTFAQQLSNGFHWGHQEKHGSMPLTA